ncbi:DNA directed RNA polymerase subunit delta [Spiroplasma litorale]|uniref:RNAP delta factor n=1 Tax=Spiroplasma litorale TaxID=216942 RepID=A0A0K1W3B4_9MOLU|nr:DNA-directed RNA polymerase subunit delta [Spiroplasma litorale]AKX34681.1 DNA directed RNA polymerase subunit delta [Spiroplasma litorale]
MHKTSPIELAYKFLSSVKNDMSFEDIWNAISREIDANNERKNEIIAELYSDLVLDNRFALTSDGKWALRDYLKFEDVKKQYEYVDKFETTEEFDDLDNYATTDLYYYDGDTGESVKKAKQRLDSDLDSDEISMDDISDEDLDDDFDDDFDEDDYGDDD